jgi:hypothetical protein
LEILRYWVDYAAESPNSSRQTSVVEFPIFRLEATIRKGFEEVSALSPEQAIIKYRTGAHRPIRFADRRAQARADAKELEGIISSMDERGAWITDIEFLDTLDFKDNSPAKFKGVDTATYVSNMYKLINSLREDAK